MGLGTWVRVYVCMCTLAHAHVRTQTPPPHSLKRRAEHQSYASSRLTQHVLADLNGII